MMIQILGIFPVEERKLGKVVGDGCALPTAFFNFVGLSPPIDARQSKRVKAEERSVP
jgi:hypothetical protein